MTIVEVFPPYIYSIRYGDGNEKDEYYRLLGLWTDVDYLTGYFESNYSRMVPEVWGNDIEPEIVASQAFNEAYELENTFEELSWNTAHDLYPDYDDFFKPLDGEFVYEWELIPMKAYGPRKPSLLRMYAIKMGSNCYLITGGGIKISRTMQEDPCLNKELDKIKKVRSFLREQGIEDREDF